MEMNQNPMQEKESAVQPRPKATRKGRPRGGGLESRPPKPLINNNDASTLFQRKALSENWRPCWPVFVDPKSLFHGGDYETRMDEFLAEKCVPDGPRGSGQLA